MDNSRSSGSGFADDFNEFDLLLEDDEPQGGAVAASRTGRMPAARAATKGASKKSGSERPRICITPDWNRVAAVVVVVAVIAFIFYFAATSIMDNRREGAYKDYFKDVRDITTQSTAQGVELANILAGQNEGTTAQRIANIEGLSGRAEKLAQRADELEAPEQMATAQAWFTTSIAYRANGIEAVQRALGASIDSKDQEASAATVSAAFSRLVASDVLMADSFAAEARSVLKADDVEGVTVPDSVFAPDTDLYGPKAVKTMLDRLRSSGAATKEGGQTLAPKDGKIRGGEVGVVAVAPSGQTLVAGGLTEIKGGENISFEVPFTNQGEVQLTEVPVKVTIRGEESDAITLTGVIEVVDPGQTATAKISLDEPPNFGETLEFDVLVGPIPGEKTADNNRTTGEIRFTL